MADEIRKTLITELAEDSSAVDTDLFVVGDQGGSTLRKMTFANLAAAIKNKIASWTFSALNTTSKTLPGAVNEINTKSDNTSNELNQGLMYRGTSLTDANNTSLTPGVYRIAGAGTVANIPAEFAYGMLVVFPGGYNTQLLVNFNKVYTRDYTGNPVHWSEWADIYPTKTIVTANISKNNVRKNTAVTVGTLTLPAGHTYLVISYLAFNKSGTGAYNHAVTGSVSGARTIRSTEQNGGGSCNVGLFNGGQTITTQVYLTTADDVTVSGALQAVKMY